ncbi:hypothetical protein MAQ5080_03163 [Marinomonas aquimarina]|uniref:Uncharacterized protein n=1 Tax=Marinomonas aquimarina TaxID=295068 RepID=A0A1A8TQJ9_9GAMM|nr:hypothetical protein MAQ5080_03163 [Marinomonas aquimarina]
MQFNSLAHIFGRASLRPSARIKRMEALSRLKSLETPHERHLWELIVRFPERSRVVHEAKHSPQKNPIELPQSDFLLKP